MSAYNAERFIKESIDSILAQKFTDFELLIADDGSTDSTKYIIDSYSDKRIKTFHNEHNYHKPVTVQKLFEKSIGEIITIHDADDISTPNRFAKMISLLNSRPDIYMSGHSMERMSESGRPLGVFRNKETDFTLIKENMRYANTDGDASMFIRRDVLDSIGQVFRPYFKNNMDYDLALRIIERYKTTNVPEVLYYYRNVSSSISKGDNSYKKLITQKVTQFLAKERAQFGHDSLQQYDLRKIRQMEDEFSKPYLADITLYHRERAEFFMHCKMNFRAIKLMLIAVILNPFRGVNWRTLQYCIRKTIFKF
ncbi:glycosyltransferase [Fulvivirga maritima]|uniref:glycosyltransferase family 2 protein n=1 Tax=Fulvivirga maritima TaxID=2904247 RepID=UPI001F1EA005|nr:glycosyltransferase [Fulvivirga maritima]UII27789.1 glycosyltransferase [Fulvivirga maritima]